MLAHAHTPVPAIAADASRASVAVVDDDADFARYLETFLAVRGCEGRSYTRGDQILAAIRHGDCPDTVFLDVAMPGMDGLETLKALKHARPDLEVIMLSGREQASIIVEALHLGAADYVVKPHDPDGLGDLALDAAIAQAIEHHHALTNPTASGRPSDDPRGLVPGWDDSPAMREVSRVIERVCDSDVTVLIRGESGVGKELVARGIHDRSSRRQMPFVKVNCAALPAELIESELFGHEKGAFTGAAVIRIGKFEQAHLGTIFLDEIGELKPALQAKLLQVLQDGEFTRLGGNKTIRTDARVLAATNQDLEDLIQRGEFREDFYYRLKVIETVVPPLRERREEILPLADFFMAKYSERYRRPMRLLPTALWRLFQAYDWPGNVRELENTIKRFVILQDEQRLTRELSTPGLQGQGGAPMLPASSSAIQPAMTGGAALCAIPVGGEEGRRLVDIVRQASLAAERVAILDTLRQVRWNRKKAAQMLAVSYKTLLNKIKETGIGPSSATRA